MKKYLLFLMKWVLIFFAGSVLIFVIARLLPTSPVDHYLAAMSLPLTDENREIISKSMGLDQPVLRQYLSWITNFIRGDWGTSLTTRLDIREEFMRKMPYSFGIGLGGILLGALFGYLLGYRAALHRGGLCDHASAVLSVFTQSVPGFIVAILIIYLFGVKLHVAKFFTGDGKLSVASAVGIMALYRVGPWSRVVRNTFREEMNKSYVRFSVSRGIPKEKVLFCHACKPVLCTLIAAMMADFAIVFGASSVLEFAFAIPGLSYFLVRCMKNSDYNVIQSYVLVVILWMFFVHLILHAVLELLDVRRRKN